MFSVIIPVYNASSTIEACVASIIHQDTDTSEVEVILVNDGSRDNSLDICNKMSDLDQRIRVINQKNLGVSAARNTGMRHATKDYIVFVDADDYVETNYFSSITKQIKLRNALDLIVFGFSTTGDMQIQDDFELLRQHPHGFQSDELLEYMVSTRKDNRFRGFVWRCAFSKEFLVEHNLRFWEGVHFSEDYQFVLAAINNTNDIAVIPERLYIYHTNEQSVTAKYNPTLIEDIRCVNNWIYEHVCISHPHLVKGYSSSCAESYLVILQNLCCINTPYDFAARVREAYRIRRKHGYSEYILATWKQDTTLSVKRKTVYGALLLHMDFMYLLLFSIKKGTIFLRGRT